MNTNQPTNPPNADVILRRFRTPTPSPPRTPLEQTGPATTPTEPNWLKAKTLLRSAVKDYRSAEAGALEQEIHQLHVQNELISHELQGIKQSIEDKKRKKAKQKVLPLYSHTLNRQGGAVWWSPHSKHEADVRDAAIEKYNLEQEAAKKTRQELQHQARLLGEKEKREKRVAREEAKERREKEKAEERAAIDARKAERERQKQARDAQQSIQLPNQGKRKAPRQLQPKTMKKRSDSAGRSQVAWQTADAVQT
ncbi:hypothetical protein EJ07DRAFT_172453 [Lizonia empirigonia]|nr:hypothetical protein EJ07DRAFT_172453 [Lizonia empirigonia]